MNEKLKQIWSLLQNKNYLLFLFVFLTILSAVIIWTSIANGSIPFWYDPARDLLLALSNLHKPTLIGSPTGIPGLFYGPYWIWFISFTQVFSKDPRTVAFVVLFLPYFVLGTSIFFLLAKKMGSYFSLFPFLLLFLQFPQYESQIWNPHLTPLILLTVVLLLSKFSLKKRGAKIYLTGIGLGFLAGLTTSFHFSLGVATMAALVSFLIIDYVSQIKVKFWKESLSSLPLLITVFCGIVISFLPFFVFEAKHGFNQIKSLTRAFSQSFFYNSAVVGQTGLTKSEIVNIVYSLPTKLFFIPQNMLQIFWTIFGLLFLITIFKARANLLSSTRGRLIIFLSLLTTVFLYILLSSKNPVWDYHFIGLETILIIAFAIFAASFRPIGVVVCFFVVFLSIQNFWFFLHSTGNWDKLPTLSAKERIVQSIVTDSVSQPYAYFAYSPAIYTYDYDYLFSWIPTRNQHFPVTEAEAKMTYLIIPPSPKNVLTDFVNYRTSNKIYSTVFTKTFPDGTIVIKRQKI